MLNLDAVCTPSPEVAAREIGDDLIVVPLTSAAGDGGTEILTLNGTGRAIWSALDGRRTLREVAALVAAGFDAPVELIEEDVVEFAGDLTRRRLLVAPAAV